MYALKICVLRSITSLYQCLETSLHQCAYAAAQNRLLTKQVCLSLYLKGGLQDTCPGAADSLTVSQGHIGCLACCILMHGNQTWGSPAPLVLASDRVARSLWRNHGYVNILRRNNLSEMDGKTVGKHQHHARTQVWCDGLLIHGCLLLIINQNHNHIGLLGCLSCRIYFKSLLFSLFPGTASLIQTNNHVAA